MSQVKPAAPAFLWRFANVEFDEASRDLRVAGHNVEIEPRPLEILLQLLRRAGEVVPKDDLMDAVYGHRHLSDGALSQAIRRLRRVLCDDAQRVITTVHRVGYKLTAEVNRVEIAGMRPRALLWKAGESVPRRPHWRLVRPLGGAEVEVWLIEHEKTRSQRVLKLCTELIRLPALKREVTLARVLKASLGERRDLVSLIDWDFDESPYFTESEYGGIPLTEWAASLGGLSQISLEVRIQLVAATADVVALAHSASVLHKDLKPANILAYQDAEGHWQPRLIDFGSGRLLEPDRLAALRITQLGLTSERVDDSESLSGTPLYLAPELLAGQVPSVQTDVYALGVLLYQMVVGDFNKPVVSGWEEDIEDAVLRADIASAMHGNPVKRVKSAQDLAQCLRDQDSRRASAARFFTRSRRRFAATAVAVCVGVALAGWQVRRHWEDSLAATTLSANVESKEAYLHALAISHRRQIELPEWLALIGSLQHAVALDPGFAGAWALLSQESAHLFFNHYNPAETRGTAIAALQAAKRLRPRAAETLIAQGYYSYWIDADYAAAARIMRDVHLRWPGNIDATLALARIARRMGNYSDSARYFEEALTKDRLNMELAIQAAELRVAMQQFPAALKLADFALDISANDVQAIAVKAEVYQSMGDLKNSKAVLASMSNQVGNWVAASSLAEQARLERAYPAAIQIWQDYLKKPESSSESDTLYATQQLGHVLLMSGDAAAARAVFSALRETLEEQRGQRPSDPRPVGQLALLYADLGDAKTAESLAKSAASFDVVQKDAIRMKLYRVTQAIVAARIGKKDQAFSILTDLQDTPFASTATPGLLKIDPEWDTLRDDMRFPVLLKAAEAAAARDRSI